MSLKPDQIQQEKDGSTTVKLFSGDCYVTNKPNHMFTTILGSCVSACMRDPVAKVGGMNHFLLPGENVNDSARYGAFAMEQLINDILKMGGRKERLELKVFGGGNVLENSAMIGSKNAAFIREFAEKEGLKILSEHLGGNHARRVQYFPDTGKARMKALGHKEDAEVVKEEKQYEKVLKSHQKDEGDIELF